jgi:hypothetical protein
MQMNPTLQAIIRILEFIILEEIIRRFSTYLFTKYRIKERKILLLICILFILGGSFTITGIYMILTDQRDEILSLTSFLCYSAFTMTGIGLLILLVFIIVRKEEIYPVDTGAVEKENRIITRIKEIRSTKLENRMIWGWIFTLGGFLIVAGCLFLFLQYGPINEPYISPEHETNDAIINFCCASSALTGILLFIIGVRMINRKRKKL